LLNSTGATPDVTALQLDVLQQVFACRQPIDLPGIIERLRMTIVSLKDQPLDVLALQLQLAHSRVRRIGFLGLAEARPSSQEQQNNDERIR
jgi:hypothetical protein